MILLTGATGFVGKETLRKLKQKGYAVRVLVRDSEKTSKDADFQGVEIVEGDLMDILSIQNACQNVEYIIHCAAAVSFHSSDKAMIMRTNVEGTANLVNVALEANIRKFIHVSSIAALGRSNDHEPITENTKWKSDGNNSLYAQSKFKAEKEVYRGIAEGLPAVIALPGVILGPGNWKSGSSAIFRFASKGIPFYPAGSNGFVSVGDVADALIRLMESDFKEGEKFILVSQSVTYQLILTLIAKELGIRPPIWLLPPFWAQMLGLLSELISKFSGTRPMLSRETSRTSSKRYIYDGSLYSTTFQVKYQNIEEIIKLTCAQFLNSNGNNTQRPKEN
jgi:nucleoside-diphosphate-sugar epimerase